MKYYRLDISSDSKTYPLISEILGVTPLEFDTTSENYNLWCYGVEENEEDETPYLDFINLFLDILEPKFTELQNIGIQREDITIWKIYVYDMQCAMEFTPQEMKRLGENGITLCIDCFQK